MKRLGLALSTAAFLSVLAPYQPAHAGSGGAVAAGIVGGLAAGTIIGAAVAQPRYYYPPPPVVVAPVAVAPGCYWTKGAPVWDDFRGRWVRPRLQVCN